MSEGNLTDDFWTGIPDDVLTELVDGLEDDKMFPPDILLEQDYALFNSQGLEFPPLTMSSYNYLNLSKENEFNIPKPEEISNPKIVIEEPQNSVYGNSPPSESRSPSDVRSPLSDVRSPQSEARSPSECSSPAPVEKTKKKRSKSPKNDTLRVNPLERVLSFPPRSFSVFGISLPVPQFNPPTDVLSSFLSTVKSKYELQEKELEALGDKQMGLTVQQVEEMAHQPQILFKLHTQITHLQKECQEFLQKYILKPTDLHSIFQFLHDFQIQLVRVEVFRSEIQAISTSAPLSNVTLVIVNEPKFCIVFKGRAISNSFLVNLVIGAKTNVKQIGKSQALVTDEELKKKKPLTKNESIFNSNYQAEFTEITPVVSTRMNPIQLQFSTTVTVQTSPKSTTEVHVQSIPSNPIIIITNESQWSVAAQRLLLAEIFYEKSEITWSYFVNSLQDFILRTTHQKTSTPERCLNALELEYFHTQYFESQKIVQKKQVEDFWKLFGEILTTIRFKRHIRQLWTKE